MRPFICLVLSCLALLLGLASAQNFDWQALGDETYTQHCAACHQPNGEGVAGVFPSLVGSEVLLGDPQEVIRLVLHGRGAMPAFETVLSDEQVAAVISHERNSWGNEAEPVTPEMVAEVRAPDAEGEDAEGEATEDAEVTLAAGWEAHGAELYADYCSACHQDEGQGVPREGTRGYFPNLAGNAYVVSDPASVIATIVNGRGGMPSFRSALSSEEIAHVVSHIRTAWGNQGSLVGEETVSDVAAGRLSPADPTDPNYRPGAGN
jgi:mono/diheme cytochrome c family protein